MKKLLFSLLMLSPIIVFAETIEMHGIYYNLDHENFTAEVISNPHKYTGYVEIPNHIYYIENSFYRVTSIGEYAFEGCNQLSHVDIPNSIESIGKCAFRGCSNIMSITIPESIDSIGTYAFDGCGFQHVLISDMVAWCNITFDSYKSNPVSCSHRVYLYGEDIINLEIPEELTEIKDFAFCNFTYLKSVVIPSGVCKIGNRAFANSKYLQDINISDNILYIGSGAFDNTAWLDNHSDGVVYAGLHLYGYKGTMPSGTNIDIKEGTKTIVGNAFEDCSGLSSIIIPSGLEIIGDYSFQHCPNLTNIFFPQSVTSIGVGAFFDCESLSNVEIGSGIKTIGDSSFGWCPNLNAVRCLAETIPKACDNTFNGSFDKAILYVPAHVINDYKATEPWSRFKKVLTLEGEEVVEPIIPVQHQLETDCPMNYFSVDGKKVNKNRKGVNIIQTTPKKPIKVVVK